MKFLEVLFKIEPREAFRPNLREILPSRPKTKQNFFVWISAFTCMSKLLIPRSLKFSFVRMGKYAVEFVCTNPYEDQKPGTSGLRKPTRRFLDNKYYTENFIQVKFFRISSLNIFNYNVSWVCIVSITICISRVFSQQ